MPELLSPGVFIEERTSQAQQIVSVSTSNFATMGWTTKGPTNQATLITSLEQFFNTFGSFNKYSDLAYGMTGYFQNGGTRAYVVRVVADDAETAYAEMGTYWRFDAISEGIWGNNLRVELVGNENFYTTATATYTRFDLNIYEESADGEGDFELVESFTELDLSDEDSANYILTVVNSETTGSSYVQVSALNGGIPSDLESTEVTNESIGSGDGITLLFNHTTAQQPVATDTVQIKVNGVLQVIDDGEGNLEGVSGVGATGTIDYDTGSVELFFVAAPAGGSSITIDYYVAGDSSEVADLANGSDGTPANIGRSQTTSPTLATDRQGIYAFDVIDEFLNFGLMDWSDDKTISLDLIAYCENRKDCFAVLDVGEGFNATQAVRYKRTTLASQSDYAAIYWPRVKVADILKDNVPKIISPVGHIVGCYARTDVEQTVGKSPAGLNDGQLNGILELEFKTDKGMRDTVYPAALNPLREDAFVGRAVWGGKTLAITGDFTRVHVRRLFIFLEKSVFNSTHDLVFENIGPRLFSTVKLRLDGFLINAWQDSFFGSTATTPDAAFRVVVDDSNNTNTTIAAGQLITDLFIRPNEAAEFIRFRFQRLIATS